MNEFKVQVTLYRWAGRKFAWQIGTECEECDRSVQLIREILETEFQNAPVKLEVKNWLDHLSEALRHRAWHPPAILINGRRFSQGVVPNRYLLINAIRANIAFNHPRCPVCSRTLVDENYSDHRKSETKHRVIRFIQAQYPEWSTRDGICPRCIIFYERLLERRELIA